MGYNTSDDACVYRLRDDLAAVQTVDFFPPMVDDAFLYGQIAAANALSDLYAMGAQPRVALNLVCFPSCLPNSVLRDILAGGYAKVHEAGAVIAGGHSIEDETPKYGLSVTGFAHPNEIWANRGAVDGDVLVLTKALGSGIATTAAKANLMQKDHYDTAVSHMASLNKAAYEAGRAVGLSACTDITGFGLLGHLCEMLQGGETCAVLDASRIALLPGVFALAEEGIIPKNTYTNREHFGRHIHFANDIPLAMQDVLFDPQTSGGMLMSLPREKAGALLRLLENSPANAQVIGFIQKGTKPLVSVENTVASTAFPFDNL